MRDADIDEAFELALELGAWSAARIRESTSIRIETKADPADVVTDVDRAVERHVRAVLAERFPHHRIEGEEDGGTGPTDATATWFVDPIDGTSNFAAGLPWSSFSLSLADAEGAVLGIVIDPWRDETFVAARGRGATRNGHSLHVREATSLDGALILTELRGHEPWEGMFDLMTEAGDAFATTRILGSTALSLVSTAAGRSVATVLGAHDPIDDLAGLLIAREAGAVVELNRSPTIAVLVAAPGIAHHRLFAGK